MHRPHHAMARPSGAGAAALVAGLLVSLGNVRPTAGQAATTAVDGPVRPALARAGDDARARDDRADSNGPPEFRVQWNDRPSFAFGDAFRLDVTAVFQFEARQFEPAFGGRPDAFGFARKRVGVDGRLGSRLAFQFESEIQRDNPVRDAFVEVRLLDALQVRGGRFKAPIARDELTSDATHDFVHRSRMSDMLAIGRDDGGALFGKLLDRRLEYQVGVFRHDGSNVDARDRRLKPGAVTAARITARPFPVTRGTVLRGETSFGLSYSTGWVPEGLNGLRHVSLGGAEVCGPVFVKGRRQRVGVDGLWTPGPFSIRAEWLRATDQRRGQGPGERDLSDVIGQGGYVSTTWLLTGERKAAIIEPRRELLVGAGPGAWELAIRWETLEFSSQDQIGPATVGPRAEHILGNREDAWTLGVNWFLHLHGKAQFNAVRERFEDGSRTPNPGSHVFWSFVTRLQFAM